MHPRTVRWLVAATTLACPCIVDAGTLTTALMPANGTNSVTCLATNVGDSEAEVVITAKNLVGKAQDMVSVSCPKPLAVGVTCSANFGTDVDVWCSFQVKGKVKATINSVDSAGNPSSSLPATE